MHYEVESDRQSCGSCSGETHRVVRVEVTRWPFENRVTESRVTVAIFRRYDMAADLCGEFNKPRGFVASRRQLLTAAA